jgi:hypothetical protein
MNAQFPMKHFLIILFSTAVGFVFSQQALDLQTCLKMADSANLSIRNAALDRSINTAQRSVYLAARYPQLNFNADY